MILAIFMTLIYPLHRNAYVRIITTTISRLLHNMLLNTQKISAYGFGKFQISRF